MCLGLVGTVRALSECLLVVGVVVSDVCRVWGVLFRVFCTAGSGGWIFLFVWVPVFLSCHVGVVSSFRCASLCGCVCSLVVFAILSFWVVLWLLFFFFLLLLFYFWFFCCFFGVLYLFIAFWPLAGWWGWVWFVGCFSRGAGGSVDCIRIFWWLFACFFLLVCL